MSESETKVLEYIKNHVGASTSDIILALNEKFDVLTVIDALDSLMAQDKIYPKDKHSIVLTQSPK